MTDYNIAQVNIGRMVDTIDSETMSGFVARLDEINAIADDFEGFVWRLQTEEGDATALRPYEDDMMIINMSVWKSMDALFDFTYKSTHVELLKPRHNWFEHMKEMYMCMWWQPADVIPTPEDAKQRLAYLNQHGVTPYAFTFKKRFTIEEMQAYQVIE